MGRVHRRLAARTDDVLCAVVLPAAIYVISPTTGAATAAVLAGVALLACLSDYHCESALSVAGGAAAVLASGWVFGQNAGQLARLGLLAGGLLLTAGTLLSRGGGSVTGGEALLLGQAAALLCAASANQLPELILFGAPLVIGQRAAVVHLLQTAFCFLLGLLLVLTYLPSARKAVWLHLLLALLAGAIIVTTSAIINTNCLVWMVEFATDGALRVRLLTWWISLLGGAVFFAVALSASGSGGLSRAVLRKLFHLLICGVFVPGLLYDPLLLLAASGGLTFLFIIAEIARTCRLQPWASIIQRWFQPFLDSKDGGFLVLSNIYLLAACSGVLWYHADAVTAAGHRQDLSLFAGVITVGVGDTVAAVIGSQYGRHRWARSPKTVEGSLAAIAAQLLFCYFLDHAGYLSIGQDAWRALCVAIGVTTLAEAFTSQADNLLLPPLFVIAFKMAARYW